MKPLTILFLDFDGVLHPFFPLADLPDEENKHFSYLPNFEQVVRENSHVRIVISSTWRLQRSLDEIKMIFSPDIAQLILGVTPTIPGHDSHVDGGRQVECEAWLAQKNLKTTPWIAIDDMFNLFSPGGCLVVAHDGFREREMSHLRKAIENPNAWKEENPVPGLNKNEPKKIILLDGFRK